jgi:hypothetical protein
MDVNMMNRLDAFNAYLDEIDDEDIADGVRIEFRGVLNDAMIESLSEAYGAPLPEDFLQFLRTVGPSASESMGDAWNTLDIFADEGFRQRRIGLLNYIDRSWGGRPEIAGTFSRDQIDAIDTQYAAIGVCYIDDNVHQYLFFDRDGGFHLLQFDQDDPGAALRWLRTSLSQPVAGSSFDAMLEAVLEGMRSRIELER